MDGIQSFESLIPKINILYINIWQDNIEIKMFFFVVVIVPKVQNKLPCRIFSSYSN